METYDPHKTETELRQASPTLDNFWVLILSMLGVIAVFGIVYFVFMVGSTPPSVIAP